MLTLQNMHEFNFFVSQGTCFGCFNKATQALTKKIIICFCYNLALISRQPLTYFGYWVAHILLDS